MEEFLAYHMAGGAGDFTNNLVYVYLFACVAIINYNAFSKSQKVVLIYLSTLSMRLFVPTGTMFTVVIMLITMFLMEEYLNPDQKKIQIIHSGWAKLGDFIYSFFFLDAGAWMLVTLFVLSQKAQGMFEVLCGKYFAPWIPLLFALVIAWRTMHVLVAPKFVVKEYREIYGYFERYVYRNLNLELPEVRRRLELLTELEDRSYFIREKSYNWISLEFLEYKLNQSVGKQTAREEKRFQKLLEKAFSFLRTYGLKRFLKYIGEYMGRSAACQINRIKSALRRIRGGATLEMQLVRQLAIAEGYNCRLRRKVLEFAFTFIFFPELKKYYERNNVEKGVRFKEFLLYVYLHSVRVKVNGFWFESIEKMMRDLHGADGEKFCLEDCSMTELYVAYLALTGAEVSDKRLILYPEVIRNYQVDLNYARWFSAQIKCRRIKPDVSEDYDKLQGEYQSYLSGIKERHPEDCFYRIGQAVFPFVENNTYYGAPEWPSYGHQNCWYFALEVYRRIWGQDFNSFAGTEDDMLRTIPSKKERSITAEHAKKYILAAEPGAVIRISDTIEGMDRDGFWHHSQILLEKKEQGAILYQSTDECTSIRYFTWEAYAREYAQYKYFKYIKFPMNQY